MKRNIFITMMSILLFISSSHAFAAEKDDLTGHPLEKQMRSLNEAGIMNGYGNGKFLPEREVTRAEFSAFLSRALSLPVGKANQFSDVKGHSLEKEVAKAASAGLIKGIGGGLFAPNHSITREEMAVMVDRAVQTQGIKGKIVPIGVIDQDKIKYKENVSRLFDLRVMTEFPDHTFRPKEKATRSQTAYTIYKMLQLIENKKIEQVKKEAIDNKPGTNKPGLEIPTDPNSEKFVRTKKFTIIYQDDMITSLTYVSTDTEMKFLGRDAKRVKVELAGVIGYVSSEDVDIKEIQADKSFYQVKSGNIYHFVLRNGKLENYLFGPAPNFIAEGAADFSWDGKTFTNGTNYQYFNYLPLTTTSAYTGEELDRYIAAMKPDSPLVGLGPVFKKVEAEVGVNALYLMAHAIHESAWGTSTIAREKKNLYGLKATDDDPLGNASQFKSFEDSIRFAANYVKTKYLTPGERTYYRGAVLGNKGVGMNIFYASDPYWGQKIAGQMYRADQYLGQKDAGKYQLAVNKVSSLNVRGVPEVGKSLLYDYPIAGIPMIVLDNVQKDNGLWYKIKSDRSIDSEAYVYGKGQLGDFVELVK